MNATSAIPTISYKDPAAAIAWLRDAFGFQDHLIVPGDDNKIIHAELRLGEVIVMISAVHSGSPYSKLIMHPEDSGGFETNGFYIVVDAPDVVYESAKKAGAKIAIDLKDETYGGRGFTCFDPEGHLWTFDSYDPWQAKVK